MGTSRTSRGQVSLEFITLVFMAFVFFAAMSSVIVSRMSLERMKQRAWEANSINDILYSEISSAGSADGNYSREFTLPYNLLGSKYNISVVNDKVIKLTYKNLTYYKWTKYEVIGQPKAGENKITKINNSIVLNQ